MAFCTSSLLIICPPFCSRVTSRDPLRWLARLTGAYPLRGLYGNSISNQLYSPISSYLVLAIPFDLPPDDHQTAHPESPFRDKLARTDGDAEAGGVGCEVPSDLLGARCVGQIFFNNIFGRNLGYLNER